MKFLLPTNLFKTVNDRDSKQSFKKGLMLISLCFIVYTVLETLTNLADLAVDVNWLAPIYVGLTIIVLLIAYCLLSAVILNRITHFSINKMNFGFAFKYSALIQTILLTPTAMYLLSKRAMEKEVFNYPFEFSDSLLLITVLFIMFAYANSFYDAKRIDSKTSANDDYFDMDLLSEETNAISKKKIIFGMLNHLILIAISISMMLTIILGYAIRYTVF
jgi:hypothetical protein